MHTKMCQFLGNPVGLQHSADLTRISKLFDFED